MHICVYMYANNVPKQGQCCCGYAQGTPLFFPTCMRVSTHRIVCFYMLKNSNVKPMRKIHTHKYTHTHTHIHIQTNQQTHIYTHTHTHTQTHANTKTHTYTRNRRVKSIIESFGWCVRTWGHCVRVCVNM